MSNLIYWVAWNFIGFLHKEFNPGLDVGGSMVTQRYTCKGQTMKTYWTKLALLYVFASAERKHQEKVPYFLFELLLAFYSANFSPNDCIMTYYGLSV